MKIKKFISLVILLSMVISLIGCSNSNLTQTEQLIYNLAKEHNSLSAKVELNSIAMFSLKDGIDENIHIDEYINEGQYIYLSGQILWDNGAKDNLFYKYTKNESGTFQGKDMYNTSSSSSSLQRQWDSLMATVEQQYINYYKYLAINQKNISYEEFQNGELGCIYFDDESIYRINKKLQNR